MTGKKKLMVLIMSALIAISAFGSVVLAAEGDEGSIVQPRAVTHFSASCSSTKASYVYANNTADTCFMEATGTVYDILGNEMKTLYRYGDYGLQKGFSATYNGAGIYRFVVYAFMYDGPNAGYKVIDRQYKELFAN